MDNATPLKPEKKSASKFFIFGNVILFTAVIFLSVFFIGKTKITNQEKAAETSMIFPTAVPTIVPTKKLIALNPTATSIPTKIPSPSLTATPTVIATPIPVPCGTKNCNDSSSPCRQGYICIQANDGSSYCSIGDSIAACKTNPSFNSCCTTSKIPTTTTVPTATIIPTKTTSVPAAGIFQWGVFGIIGTIIVVGLLL